MSVIAYFSGTYSEGRGNFLDACRAIEGRAPLTVESIAHPLAGPGGEPLFTDVAMIGPADADRVLVLNSGTHGNEGPCGSGCLVGWLREERWGSLPAGVRVVLIHAINPHGFAWVRRVTEDNVDLNRNFVDHDDGHPDNADYDEIHAELIPSAWAPGARAAADRALEAFAKRRGRFALQAAITRGQYSHPDGLFYGGRRPTWSNLALRDIARRLIAPAKTVAFIDYHTGLGPYGAAELIADAVAGTPAYARMESWYGQGMTSPEAGTSRSATLAGTIFLGLVESLPGTEILSLAMEYGTFELKRVLDALRGDHWLHNNPDADPAMAGAIKAEIRTALYPDEDDWKELVYLRSRQIVDRAVRALGEGR